LLIHGGPRWYGAQIGRWISAETIIPDFTHSQSYNVLPSSPDATEARGTERDGYALYNKCGEGALWPAYSATIALMLPKKQYARANGMLEMAGKPLASLPQSWPGP
jgi:hypothetical protein